MIGLMYLVLLALLAMNVSKAVLDAFVAIENNLQVAAVTQLERGNSAESDLKSEADDKSNPIKQQKIRYYLDVIKKINKITAENIEKIDAIKMDILKQSGEVLDVKNENEETVIWVPYNKAKEPLKPAKINLMAINAKDQYDVPMHTIIGENLEPVTGSGKELWADYNKFRGELCDLLGTYAPPGGRSFKFKSKAINSFKNNADLEKQVEKMINANTAANLKDDAEDIKTIYMALSKNEFADMGEEKHLHWVARTFDHAPLVAALASLTAVQQEILNGRASAIACIKARVSTGEYSFNKVIGLAFGPQLANSGDDVEISVMMAAFDSDNKPEVKTNSGQITYLEGKGIVKVKASGSNEMVLNGTVSIKKKSGETKTEQWTHTIKIMKPMGTVSLPDMRVLYRGYDNKVEGVASGYDETVLSMGGGLKSLNKKGLFWIAIPGTDKSATITISGRSSITKKTVPLGKFVFKVSNLPSPQVFLGSIGTGTTNSKSAVASSTKLFAKYPPEITLNATFDVGTWELTVSGAPRSISGSGNSLSAEAINLLKQCKPGAKVSISAKYKGMGYSGNMASIITVN